GGAVGDAPPETWSRAIGAGCDHRRACVRRPSMNRRRFLSSLSAAAAAPLALAEEGHAPAPARMQVSLSGTWQRYVFGVAVDTVEVPSSLRPSGYYSLTRSYVIPKPGPAQRVIAHFDAVNFRGRLFVNKTEAGTTLPYV